MLTTVSRAVLSVVYPQECSCCQQEVETSDDGIACSDCWDKTRIIDGSETLCTKCGALLFAGHGNGATPRCGKCDDQCFDRAISVGIYEHALSATVLHLKRTPSIPKRLKNSLIQTLDRTPPQQQLTVIPIPLAARRLHERGFNQAAFIGRILARAADLPFDEISLIRKIHTPMHRAGMDRKARARTVKNAFEVVRPKLVAGRDILLVDDVLTSGETASTCSQVLKKNGAATVTVLMIARAG